MGRAPTDVCFVLPGVAKTPVGGYRVVYEYADLLAHRGYAVTIAHMRMSHLRFDPRLQRTAKRLGYSLTPRRRPNWFDLDKSVQVRNQFIADPALLPDAHVYVATSVGTAPIVADRVHSSGAKGLYLIQHVEDFTLSIGEVESSWRLPLQRIVVSRWLQDELARRQLPAHLIENGVDRDVFRPAQTQGRRAGVFAMVSPQEFKRTDLVIEVYNELAQTHPQVPLKTFGACDTPDGLPKNAQHHREPSREKLANLYRGSKVFVCSSDTEGFGLPALEAMSSGCAVVTTDNGGVPAFAGEAVLTVRTGDASELYRACVELLTHASIREQFETRGIRRAEELSAARSCDALEALIVKAGL